MYGFAEEREDLPVPALCSFFSMLSQFEALANSDVPVNVVLRHAAKTRV